MKDKIAFIAVGQAGGNIGQLFESMGYTVLYINTSREDLETLENAKFRYHVSNGEGCNKDRHKAKHLIVEDFDNIAAEIEAKLQDRLLFVIFASGGGTGSGAGPMLIDLLLDDGREVGAVTILPSPAESVKAHINSYECFTELTQLQGTAACFILDNNRGDKINLNEQFADDFNSFLEIPEKYKSLRGNIDRAEIEETLKAHGMAMIVHAQGVDSSQVIQALTDNEYAPAEADRTVKYITAALAGNVSMEDLEKAVGTPVDTFRAYSGEESICCVCGMTYPKTRLEEMYNKVAENKDTIRKNLEATQENKEVLKNLKNGECLFQDLDRHIGILRFDAVFQDIIDLFSTTPKAKGQEEEQEAEQIDQTETEESRQSEKKVEENQTETMEDELNFEFDMEELLKKESV